MADASASLPGLNFAGLEKTADSVLEMVDEAQHHVFDIQSRLKKLGLESIIMGNVDELIVRPDLLNNVMSAQFVAFAKALQRGIDSPESLKPQGALACLVGGGKIRREWEKTVDEVNKTRSHMVQAMAAPSSMFSDVLDCTASFGGEQWTEAERALETLTVKAMPKVVRVSERIKKGIDGMDDVEDLYKEMKAVRKDLTKAADKVRIGELIEVLKRLQAVGKRFVKDSTMLEQFREAAQDVHDLVQDVPPRLREVTKPPPPVACMVKPPAIVDDVVSAVETLSQAMAFDRVVTGISVIERAFKEVDLDALDAIIAPLEKLDDAIGGLVDDIEEVLDLMRDVIESSHYVDGFATDAETTFGGVTDNEDSSTGIVDKFLGLFR